MSDRPTVLFITHSVEEAVGLSDRVLVMSPRPATIDREIVVGLPRPRRLDEREAPVRIVKTGRGRFHLDVARPVRLDLVPQS